MCSLRQVKYSSVCFQCTIISWLVFPPEKAHQNVYTITFIYFVETPLL